MVRHRFIYPPHAELPFIDAVTREAQARMETFVRGVRAYQAHPYRREVEDVPVVLAGLGTSILTTSRGVMTGRAAVKAGVGGEVLCNIW